MLIRRSSRSRRARGGEYRKRSLFDLRCPRFREQTEQKRLEIAEFKATEHALVQRCKHDIPGRYEMRLEDDNNLSIDDKDDDSEKRDKDD